MQYGNINGQSTKERDGERDGERDVERESVCVCFEENTKAKIGRS